MNDWWAGWRDRQWSVRDWLWLAAGACALAIIALWVATWPPAMPDYGAVRAGFKPSEAWLEDADGNVIDSERINFQSRRMGWAPLSQIPRPVRDTIIAAEDQRFVSHGGVDLLSLGGAARARWQSSGRRGASTITMQLAAFLSPSLAAPGQRGWRDKLRQMRAAWSIERGWSKAQILEAYLNLAGFRGEAQGISAAAFTLFGKKIDQLDQHDAIVLAALLPDPRASTDSVAMRACRIDARIHPRPAASPTASPAASTPQDCRPWQFAVADALAPTRRAALDPGLAPHLARKLLRLPGDRVRSLINANVQRIVTAALRQQLSTLGPDRARDGAVIVADNVTGAVIAYVGGAGTSSTAQDVDGADALRQAGSTLKPFLYGLAIERKFLTAASILDDSPVQLDTASGLYVPQNYDREFKGPVSARSALASSLNVPAVRVLLLAGVDPFRDRLWDLGYRGLTEDGDFYGFSLALGSAEVTLLQQVAAYRAIIRGGLYAPLRLRADDPGATARQVMTPEAAFIVADMLADTNARSVTFGIDSALRLPFWAMVKTGTSKAMRDNWCIGGSDRFTVGVWIGNKEGDPMKAVSGTSGAAPVWREVMLALHRGAPGKAPPAPAGVERRTVRFADAIEQTRQEWFVRGTAQAEMAFTPSSGRRPRITDPVSGSIFALDPDIPPERQQIGIGVVGTTAGYRLWLDKRDIGPAQGQPMITPLPGAHRIVLIDPRGEPVDQVLFTVR